MSDTIYTYSPWSLQLQRLISSLQYLILINKFAQLFIGLCTRNYFRCLGHINEQNRKKNTCPHNTYSYSSQVSENLLFPDSFQLLLKCLCSLRFYEISSLHTLFPCVTSLASTISYMLLQNLYVPTFDLALVFQFHESKCLHKSIWKSHSHFTHNLSWTKALLPSTSLQRKLFLSLVPPFSSIKIITDQELTQCKCL